MTVLGQHSGPEAGLREQSRKHAPGRTGSGTLNRHANTRSAFLCLTSALMLLAAGCGRFSADDASIRLSGNIELTEVNISFKIPGKLVELNVREGDLVKKGVLVAGLDQQELLDRRESARSAVAAAQSRLAQLRISIQLQEANADGQVDRSRAELRQAEAQLAQLLAGSRVQEIEQARAALEAAQAEQDRAQKDWQRAQELYKNEDISSAQYDQYRTRAETAAAALREAQERFALVKEGPRKEDIDAARALVDRSHAQLRLAEASRIEVARLQEETRTREAEIRQAQAQLAVIETQLADTEVISPIDGVVLVKSVEPGEVVAAGTTVVTIGDLDRPWLRAYVNETDLGKVKLGGEAKVTTDTFPGKTYSGRVSFISSEAEFTPKQIQTQEERVKLVYRIKIDLANPNHELKSNMPADAVIAY